MKKISKKLIWKIFITGFLLAGTSTFAISCADPNTNTSTNTKTNPHTIKNTKTDENWDTEITITYNWANKGFLSPEKNTQKSPNDVFLEKLQYKFNELKNADNDLKKYPDVIFKTAEVSNDNARDNLLIDQIDNDISIIPYKILGDKIDKNNLDQYPNYVGNTETLAFKWTLDDNAKYLDGSDNDPLIKTAKENNKIYFSENGEYPDWWKIKKQLEWDGSKYKVFYDNTDKTTQFYRGAIYISGTDDELKAIENSWKSKNWEEFSKYGIIFQGTSSLGGYRLQANLIAKNFNLSSIEVNKYFTDQENKNNKKVEQNSQVSIRLGKKDSLGHVFHIGFDDEGVLNWTESIENEDHFTPTDPNAKIRVLTLTDPAPYNGVFRRKGLSEKQSSLVMKALQSLSIEENQLGIYTGFNKFVAGDVDTFKKYIDIYNTNTIDTKNK
ncbi:ABC transporter thiamine pyrophosphate-binding lipoprotein p37/Cypl [Mycoplasma zalophi]|uniref:ABC transporter thiamine pyrophosphate-binding lipoprotein p37/Cypl n=1 Tax=Mycoplasma zalophi TaxID=191287 RepID=UPI001C0F5E19|nr:ABC transporter substrate-binding protein [Mycoplasma zalophi]MBU4691160.1 ABC transporter substrate-binding protein [Mycoplasma zalophi]